MTLDIPKVIVNTTTQVQSTIPEGLAGDVAVIADLGTSSTDIIIANNDRELNEKLGDDIYLISGIRMKKIFNLYYLHISSANLPSYKSTYFFIEKCLSISLDGISIL